MLCPAAVFPVLPVLHTVMSTWEFDKGVLGKGHDPSRSLCYTMFLGTGSMYCSLLGVQTRCCMMKSLLLVYYQADIVEVSQGCVAAGYRVLSAT